MKNAFVALGAPDGINYDIRKEFQAKTDEDGVAKLIIDKGFNSGENRIMINYGNCNHFSDPISRFQNAKLNCQMPTMSKFVIINSLGEFVSGVPVYVIGATDNKVYSETTNVPVTNEKGEVKFCVPGKLYGKNNGWRFAYGYAGVGYTSNDTFINPVNYTQTVVAINRPIINSISIVSGQAGTLKFAWENLSAKGVAKYLIRLKAANATEWTNLGVTQKTDLNISGFNTPGEYMFEVYGYNANNQLISCSKAITFTINNTSKPSKALLKQKSSLISTLTSLDLSVKVPMKILESLKEKVKSNQININDLEPNNKTKIIIDNN